MTRQRARPHPRTVTRWRECPGPARVSRPPGWLVFAVGGLHSTGKAARRDTSPTMPRFPPPVVRSSAQAAKLYSHSPERRTAPRRGLSARAGTPKEGFCNTIMRGSFWTRQRARVLWRDNVRENLIKPDIQTKRKNRPRRQPGTVLNRTAHTATCISSPSTCNYTPSCVGLSKHTHKGGCFYGKKNEHRRLERQALAH